MQKLSTFVLIFVLLASPILSITNESHFNYASKNLLQKIRSNKGSWGNILVNLASLHAATGGPLDQLLDALEDVVQDISVKHEQADIEFQERTDFHHSEVARITDLIDSAADDISSTTELLTFLAGHLATLEAQVVSLEESIEDFKENIESSTALRERQHSEFEAKIPDHEAAIAAIDEASEVLSQLVDAPSFLQVKSLKKNFEKIQKVHAGKESSLLKALVELAMSQKFNDGQTVQRVLDLMAEIRAKLVASLAQYNDVEQQQQADFEQLIIDLNDSINSANIELSNTRAEIETTHERISSAQEFLAMRQQDKAEQEEALELENQAYERYTENYNELVEQLNNEHDACVQALEFLQSSDFAGYIGNRMSQKSDVIIDQAHGTGVTLEKDPFDFE